MMMDNTISFEDYEINGRKKLQKILMNSPKAVDWEFTEDTFNNIDCYYTGVSNTAAFEIKDRDNISTTQFDDFILEKTKYDALMYEYNNNGYLPLYINFFKDKCLVWNLSKIQPTFIQKMLPATTAGNKTKVKKNVILLNKKDAAIINYD